LHRALNVAVFKQSAREGQTFLRSRRRGCRRVFVLAVLADSLFGVFPVRLIKLAQEFFCECAIALGCQPQNFSPQILATRPENYWATRLLFPDFFCGPASILGVFDLSGFPRAAKQRPRLFNISQPKCIGHSRQHTRTQARFMKASRVVSKILQERDRQDFTLRGYRIHFLSC
jgi:hypothetical protein